jgi:hypothetical protein
MFKKVLALFLTDLADYAFTLAACLFGTGLCLGTSDTTTALLYDTPVLCTLLFTFRRHGFHSF